MVRHVTSRQKLNYPRQVVCMIDIDSWSVSARIQSIPLIRKNKIIALYCGLIQMVRDLACNI